MLQRNLQIRDRVGDSLEAILGDQAIYCVVQDPLGDRGLGSAQPGEVEQQGCDGRRRVGFGEGSLHWVCWSVGWKELIVGGLSVSAFPMVFCHLYGCLKCRGISKVVASFRDVVYYSDQFVYIHAVPTNFCFVDLISSRVGLPVFLSNFPEL